MSIIKSAAGGSSLNKLTFILCFVLGKIESGHERNKTAVFVEEHLVTEMRFNEV